MLVLDELNLTWISISVCQQGADITVDKSKSGWLQSMEKWKIFLSQASAKCFLWNRCPLEGEWKIAGLGKNSLLCHCVTEFMLYSPGVVLQMGVKKECSVRRTTVATVLMTAKAAEVIPICLPHYPLLPFVSKLFISKLTDSSTDVLSLTNSSWIPSKLVSSLSICQNIFFLFNP